MHIDKSLLSGSLSLLILRLLRETDMYGYQMIAALESRSDKTFSLKAGTLYPLLHGLERQGAVVTYEKSAETGRVRKYYHITSDGSRLLDDKQSEWEVFSSTVNRVLKGGTACVGLSGKRT